MKDRIVLRWSKKENDWIYDYPDNAGSRMAGPFFDLTINFYEGKSLKDFLTAKGYDFTTFKITCNKSTTQEKQS